MTFHVQFPNRTIPKETELSLLVALVAVGEHLNMQVGGTLDDLAVEAERDVFNIWLSIALVLEPSLQIQFTEGIPDE